MTHLFFPKDFIDRAKVRVHFLPTFYVISVASSHVYFSLS